ncbi:hypothetical protein P9112_005269 [Eukaryota sp. TZLM1-RC]
MFRTAATSNDDLVDQVKAEGMLRDTRIEQAMRAIDRKDFVREKASAYIDAPASIGYGQTISAPHIHARMMELLKNSLKEGCNVLDVGCGSGYLTATMAELVGPTGSVTGIEVYPELVAFARENISKYPKLESRTKLIIGDGKKGYAPNATYDAIHVGAAADRLPPALVDQLKPGGQICIPVSDSSGMGQTLNLLKKHSDGSVSEQRSEQVMFVPLT